MASQSSTIFDILNLYIHGFPGGQNPEQSHRYYQCHEPPPNNRMGPMTCEQITYEQVKDFYHKRESTPTTDIIVPIERTTPRPLDQAVLSCKLWQPAIISSYK